MLNSGQSACNECPLVLPCLPSWQISEVISIPWLSRLGKSLGLSCLNLLCCVVLYLCYVCVVLCCVVVWWCVGVVFASCRVEFCCRVSCRIVLSCRVGCAVLSCLALPCLVQAFLFRCIMVTENSSFLLSGAFMLDSIQTVKWWCLVTFGPSIQPEPEGSFRDIIAECVKWKNYSGEGQVRTILTQSMRCQGETNVATFACTLVLSCLLFVFSFFSFLCFVLRLWFFEM